MKSCAILSTAAFVCTSVTNEQSACEFRTRIFAFCSALARQMPHIDAMYRIQQQRKKKTKKKINTKIGFAFVAFCAVPTYIYAYMHIYIFLSDSVILFVSANSKRKIEIGPSLFGICY